MAVGKDELSRLVRATALAGAATLPFCVTEALSTLDEMREEVEKYTGSGDAEAPPRKKVFEHGADYGVQLEAALLKPSMVTPGAQSGTKADAETIASRTLAALARVVPPAVPGIMFLSGGQSELEATMNLNAMNQSINPWHISFSYARALQNTCLKTWDGKDENKVAAQAKLFQRASANSKAQLGRYDPATADEDASAAEGMYVKNYTY